MVCKVLIGVCSKEWYYLSWNIKSTNGRPSSAHNSRKRSHDSMGKTQRLFDYGGLEARQIRICKRGMEDLTR